VQPGVPHLSLEITSVLGVVPRLMGIGPRSEPVDGYPSLALAVRAVALLDYELVKAR